MKDKIRRIGLLSLVLVSPLKLLAEVRTTEQTVPVLTLEAAIAQALERSERMVDMRDSMEQARLSVTLARSRFAPKIVPNVFGSFGQSDIGNQTYGLSYNQKLTTGTELRANVGTGTSRNQFGTYFTTNTMLLVGQPLLRGFGRSVAGWEIESSEARVEEQIRYRILTEQQLTVEVASAYYRVVSQQLLMDVAVKTLERARNLLEASLAKLQAGRVSQLDVFRARQLVAEAEGQLLDAQASVEDAKDEIRFLLDRGEDYDFSVERDISPARESLGPEEAAELAVENRLEIEISKKGLAEAERALAYAKNQLLPQLDVNLGLTREETAENFGDTVGFDNYQFSAFVAASMPIDRTPELVAYHNATIDRDRRRRAAETLQRRIAGEARRAARNHQRLLRGLEFAETQVEFADKELEVATLRYQRGLANNLDVVNAEVNLLAANSRRIGMVAELALADLQLRATVGTLDPRELTGDNAGTS